MSPNVFLQLSLKQCRPYITRAKSSITKLLGWKPAHPGTSRPRSAKDRYVIIVLRHVPRTSIFRRSATHISPHNYIRPAFLLISFLSIIQPLTSLPKCLLILITALNHLLRASTIPTPSLSPPVSVAVVLRRCRRSHQAQAQPSTYLPLCPRPPILSTYLSLLLQGHPFFPISWASRPLKGTRVLHFHSSARLPLLLYWKVCACVTFSFIGY
jgi:hypothetical protein